MTCHFHCGRVVASQDNKNRLPFNNDAYGLSGKGKSGKKIWTKQANEQQVQAQGEVLFGIHPVTLAITASYRKTFYNLYIDRKYQRNESALHIKHIRDMASEKGVPVEFVHKNTLNYLAGGRPHQGVCLDVSSRVFPHRDPDTLLQGISLTPNILWMLLYNVQDPMNFGAILRSSYFFGVDKILVPTENSCAASPVVSKASAGALEVMKIIQVDGRFCSIKQLAQKWQTHGGLVLGTTGMDAAEPRNTCRLENYSVSAPTLLIVGNEGRGIDKEVLDLCDTLLTIAPPLSREVADTSLQVESLNVSVATGILIHWLRFSCSHLKPSQTRDCLDKGPL